MWTFDQLRYETYNYALMTVDALSLVCHIVPCRRTIDGEGVLKNILRQWIRFLQRMVKIPSDRDIRFT